MSDSGQSPLDFVSEVLPTAKLDQILFPQFFRVCGDLLKIFHPWQIFRVFLRRF
jgi:hypothetical protein